MHCTMVTVVLPSVWACLELWNVQLSLCTLDNLWSFSILGGFQIREKKIITISNILLCSRVGGEAVKWYGKSKLPYRKHWISGDSDMMQNSLWQSPIFLFSFTRTHLSVSEYPYMAHNWLRIQSSGRGGCVVEYVTKWFQKNSSGFSCPMKIMALHSLETLGTTHTKTQNKIPEDPNPLKHQCENLKSHISVTITMTRTNNHVPTL